MFSKLQLITGYCSCSFMYTIMQNQMWKPTMWLSLRWRACGFLFLFLSLVEEQLITSMLRLNDRKEKIFQNNRQRLCLCITIPLNVQWKWTVLNCRLRILFFATILLEPATVLIHNDNFWCIISRIHHLLYLYSVGTLYYYTTYVQHRREDVF